MFLCWFQYIASLIEEVPLSIWEQYTISQTPISLNKPLSASAIVEVLSDLLVFLMFFFHLDFEQAMICSYSLGIT